MSDNPLNPPHYREFPIGRTVIALKNITGVTRGKLLKGKRATVAGHAPYGIDLMPEGTKRMFYVWAADLTGKLKLVP